MKMLKCPLTTQREALAASWRLSFQNFMGTYIIIRLPVPRSVVPYQPASCWIFNHFFTVRNKELQCPFKSRGGWSPVISQDLPGPRRGASGLLPLGCAGHTLAGALWSRLCREAGRKPRGGRPDPSFLPSYGLESCLCTIQASEGRPQGVAHPGRNAPGPQEPRQGSPSRRQLPVLLYPQETEMEEPAWNNLSIPGMVRSF